MSGPLTPPRRVQVEHIMGTAIVIDVRGPMPEEDTVERAMAAAFEHFRAVDARFSTYRDDSEVSRLNSGAIEWPSCSAELREVLAMCEKARVDSDGYFDIRRHRADGTLDPSGLVKGWSVEGAAGVLEGAGVRNYTINAAGDVVIRGEPEPQLAWRIGVRNPWDAQTMVAVLEARDLAIATSGTYERGDHVLVPHTGRTPDGIASMTVIGPSLTWADAWATAGFAMGVRGVEWVARELEGYDACAVSSDRHLVMTDGFRRLMADG